MAKGEAARTAITAALVLACLTAAGVAQSRGQVQPTVLNSRQATRLLMSQVRPEYPAVAHTNYIQGPVQLEIFVGSDGHVGKAHVLRGNPLLAASALKAVYHWLYRPCMTPEGPVPFRTQVRVNFDLRINPNYRLPLSPERDLEERLKLPQAPDSAAAAPSPFVRLRVLVSDDGHALDSILVSGSSSLLESAQENVAKWRFVPARWGNLAVPWYLDVDVPAETVYPAQASAVAGKH